MSRMVTPVFTILLTIILTACSSNNVSENHDVIRFGLNTSVVTLDPRYATDAVSDRLCRLIYQSLVVFDEQSKAVSKLADWEMLSADHYRFTLKSGRKSFHNGESLTANDVKATFDSILFDEKISPHRGALKHIQQIKVIDVNTVDFKLSRPDNLFPGRLNIGILPQSLLLSEHAFNTEPIGSGEITFDSWPSEGKVILERIHDHQRLEFITVKDPTMRVLKLVRGEIDLIQGNLSGELLQWLNQRDTIRVEQREGSIYSYLGFNLQDPVLENPAIRKAIAHAIDRNKIIDFIFAKRARHAESILTPEHWAGHPDLKRYDYNPDLSRKLLNDMGYDESHRINLTYKTSNNPFRLRLATIIQYQLKQVGIDVEIQSYDWGTFYGDIKSGKFQLYSLSWVGLNLPDIFRYVFHSESFPPAGANRGRFVDQQLDAMIDEAEMMQNTDQQVQQYHAIQEYIHQKLPYVSLWYEDTVLAIRNDLTGYTLDFQGNYDAMVTIKRKATDGRIIGNQNIN